MPGRIVVLAQDLIWADRLMGAVRQAGAEPARVTSLDDLARQLPQADGLVVDLTARAYAPLEAIERASAAGVPILAVGQHDDVGQRKAALAAGAGQVLAYRKLFEDGPGTIGRWLERATAPSPSAG